MIEPITWRDEEGNIMTKATKAKLAKRLHRLEHFLWLFTSCRVQKSHISTTAKLMKSPHVAKNPTMLECFNDMLSTHCRRYMDAREKLERMYLIRPGETIEFDSPLTELGPKQNVRPSRGAR